jgi:peroxiredoxin
MTTTSVRRAAPAGPPRLAARPDEAALRRRFDREVWDRLVRPGDRLPSLPLLEADLGPIHLDRLRMTGPVVLVFFRHASSRLGNAALAGYQRDLVPALDDLGAHLVAVSPQVPQRLLEIKRRHELSFFVAADVRHALIDAFNLGFTDPGADVLLGARRSVVPFPSVVVADRSGTVRFADVRAAGAAHPEPALIAAAVGALS